MANLAQLHVDVCGRFLAALVYRNQILPMRFVMISALRWNIPLCSPNFAY